MHLAAHRIRLGLLAVLAISPFLAANADVGRIVTGVDTNAGGPHVKVFTSRTQSNVASFFAFAAGFSGGVRVAAGDVNGDGAPDLIAGTGPGAAQVKVFSGRNQSTLRDFLPYGSGYAGGVFVAAGDVNGDGCADVVTGTDEGTLAHVKVFDGLTGAELHSFFAYGTSFMGGVRVAAGDINNDGKADIITGSGPGGGPHIKVFNGSNLMEIGSFFAYPESFLGGVYVAAGDVNGDGLADIVTGAGAGAAPHVKVFSGSSLTETGSFFAYDAAFTGGVRVAAGDVNGDGKSEILAAPGPGGAPHIRVFNGQSFAEESTFPAYTVTFTDGVFVGVASEKRPRLQIAHSRANGEIELQWPSGCLCELEGNSDPANPQGWEPLNVTPVETGTHIGLLLPAVQKFQAFRLNCDAEAVQPPPATAEPAR